MLKLFLLYFYFFYLIFLITAHADIMRWDGALTIRGSRPAPGCVCGTVSQEGFMLVARRGARNTGVIKRHRSLVLLRSTCDDTRVNHQDGFPIGNFAWLSFGWICREYAVLVN